MPPGGRKWECNPFNLIGHEKVNKPSNHSNFCNDFDTFAYENFKFHTKGEKNCVYFGQCLFCSCHSQEFTEVCKKFPLQANISKRATVFTIDLFFQVENVANALAYYVSGKFYNVGPCPMLQGPQFSGCPVRTEPNLVAPLFVVFTADGFVLKIRWQSTIF